MRIAFVTPWYGPDLAGGAETLARTTVEHLHAAGMDAEVWTTCIRSFQDPWDKNSYRPGVSTVNGVPVHRFPVQPRDSERFHAINERLMFGSTVPTADEETFIREMLRAPALYDHIRARCQDTILVFIPYMFSTTYFGAQICPERSLIVPCLHDEAYARMNIFRELMPEPAALVFNAPAERALAARLYGEPEGQRRPVIGMGIETDQVGDADRFRELHGLREPFLLYIGRREVGKNVPLLLEYWQRFKASDQRPLRLALMGPGPLAIPEATKESVVDLGRLPEQDKHDACAAAVALCQPSLNESFSIVLMESWLQGRPVLVHRDCAVTSEACRAANGGLYFGSYAEFAATLTYLLDHPEVADTLGRQGRRYVLDNYTWPDLVAKWRRLLAAVAAEVTT